MNKIKGIARILINQLPDRLRIFINSRLGRIIPLSERNLNMNPLTIIGRKYGTDKAGPTHNYTEKFYYDLFKDLRNEKINLLEIGFGPTGASAKMWREFLPNANITIFDPFLYQRESILQEVEGFNINIVVGNQLSREDLSKLSTYKEFDFIIDDASHVSDGIQISFACLFPYLKKEGFFIVEDLYATRIRDREVGLYNSNVEDGKYAFQPKSSTMFDMNSREGVKTLYHQKEIHLADALRHFKHTGEWKSLILSDKEKEYLKQNIGEYGFVQDYDTSNQIVYIKKSS